MNIFEGPAKTESFHRKAAKATKRISVSDLCSLVVNFFLGLGLLV
jgi:hypothetical protein